MQSRKTNSLQIHEFLENIIGQINVLKQAFQVESVEPRRSRLNSHDTIDFIKDQTIFLETLQQKIAMEENIKTPVLNSNEIEITEKKTQENETKTIRQETEIKPINQDIYKIVLTGGPCAGKTTAIAKLSDQLRDRGYVVFSVPEAATLIFNSSGQLNFAEFTIEMKLNFQFFLMMIQMSLEDSLMGIARNINQGKNIVIICDRGAMDGKAYMEKVEWERLISEHNINVHRIRDQRYDLVIHITTAADGAEEFYGNQNNITRKEDLTFAKYLDKNLEEAWIEHPQFVQINNKFASFEAKMTSVIMTVFKFLGIESGVDFYNKYLVSNPHGKLVEMIEKQLNLNVHVCQITDHVFFKNETKKELTYFRKRVE